MFDTLILGGLLVDGTGADAIHGDLAIENGKIAARGNLRTAKAGTVLDATGFCVTPGFVDIHRHADAAILRPGFGEQELRQGLTTIVNGNCGMAAFPAGEDDAAVRAYLSPILGTFAQLYDSFADYTAALPVLPLHVGQLAGLGTIRAGVAGFAPEVTGAQLTEMRVRLEAALADGALGVSLGLGYAPECFFREEELLHVLTPLRGGDIPLSVHLRQEGSGVVEALEEALRLARALQLPLEVSHFKAIGRANWGRAVPRMLELLHQAQDEGVRVGFDVYPYSFGATQLVHLLPPEAQAGGPEVLRARLGAPDFRAQLRERMLHGEDFENISLLCGWENIRIAALPDADSALPGCSMAELAAREGKDPFEALFDLLVRTHCAGTMFDEIVSEEDLSAILRDEMSCVISDSLYPGSGLRHPRERGAFARVIERYVLQTKALTLEQAIHKMTALPARRLGLKDKGRLIPGLDADILLFRPEALHETDGFAAGMDTVLVGGMPVLQGGTLTGKKPGRLLKR